VPFVGLGIRHVKIMYCIYVSVLEIIPSPHQMVMWRVWITGRCRNIELPKYFTQQTPVNAPHYSVDNCRFCCRVTSVVHKGFVSKLSICRPNLYWQMLLVLYYCVLKETNFKIALTVHLQSWRTGWKQTYKT